MEPSMKHKIEESLVEKRENLVEWLNEVTTTANAAPPDELEVEAVQTHLQEIDTALEKAEQGTLGECEVCCDEVDDTLLEMDYTACVCLSHLSPDERSKLEAELEFSQVIQRAMLPQQAPLLSDLDMAAYNRPAQIVSGDFFDFFPFHDGAQGIAIGDVVGHGVSAGMLMSSIQTALHLLAPESDSPATVLERINQLFLHNIHYTTFATVFLASFDSNTRELTYANAGHNPPLLYCPQYQRLTSLNPTGAAIGLLDDYPLGIATLPLVSGDILLMYTDGLVEASDGTVDAFGNERLAELIQTSAGSSAAEIVHLVSQELERYLEGRTPEDDITFVVMKVN